MTVRTEASGKSGEIFWRTRDQRYVLKTVSQQEVGQLIRMLPEYKDAGCPFLHACALRGGLSEREETCKG